MITDSKEIQRKFDIVIDYNIPFFFIPSSEEENELLLKVYVSKALELQQKIKEQNADVKTLFENIIEDEYGFKLLLTITSISFEDVKKLVDVICGCGDEEVIKLTNKNLWYKEKYLTSCCDDNRIKKLLKNSDFRNGMMNLIYHAKDFQFFIKHIPSFRLKKCNSEKLNEFHLIPKSCLDTLFRYKETGSYAASKKNNAELLIDSHLKDLNIPYETGKLADVDGPSGRTMDFCIPNKKNPVVIIESSVVSTTASGLGDKAKAEIKMREIINQKYPNAKFYGIIDGIGWARRPGDLKRMVQAFDDVFTMHDFQINRLMKQLQEMGLSNDG